MNFIDIFSGIGGFRNGLEKSGHNCIGHVEIDKYANISYMAMYNLEYCKYNKIINKNCQRICKKEVFENCNKTDCKSEWFAKDIEQVRTGEIPKAEIWTFGFPCTDLSIAGKMAGIRGKRSRLFFKVTSLLKSTPPHNKPIWLIIENVKHLLTSEHGRAFTDVLSELWEAGYDCEWSCVNSKDFGVPQNRERVYIVGHLRGTCKTKIFPIGRTNNTIIKQIINGSQGYRVYNPDGLSTTLVSNCGGFGGKTGLYGIPKTRIEKNLNTPNSLTVTYCKSLNKNQNQNATINSKNSCILSVISPAKKNTRQNGRRIKNSGEPSFTLTTQDRHGVILCKCNDKNKCTLKNKDIYKNNDLNINNSQNKLLYFKIRKLTPKECWRLQGFDDSLFYKAQNTGLSDTQLYKQAGNAVTVNIVYEIGKKLYFIDNRGAWFA